MRRRLIKWLAYAIALAITSLVTIVMVFAIQARLRFPDLSAWHTVVLEHEFRAGRADTPTTFDEYRALETRLFEDLRAQVLASSAADTNTLGRYTPNSVPGRLALDTMYNRSFELAPSNPRGAVLLVHGLSDSPYSMRGLAEAFYAQGFYVLALRLPGHGTIPASLTGVSWEDWYAAVVLAAEHAAERAGPGNPFLAGGHSTGAALVTLYSLRTLDDPALPRPEQLYLVSAAIGISPFAVFTNVISSLAFIPGLEKSRWLDVYPEYDPYKYNSFPVNAANQIYKVTRVVQSTLDDAVEAGTLQAMPRVHVFQSIVDSTVTAAEVSRGLLLKLPAQGHELVVFDVNRNELLEGLIGAGPIEDFDRIRSAPALPFKITLIANRSPATRAVAAYTREAGSREVAVEELPLEWPPGVFSLGHVALPFPGDDPVYGLNPVPDAAPSYNLGGIMARGESGALVVPLGQFARLRSNPFFDVIRARASASVTAEGGGSL